LLKTSKRVPVLQIDPGVP